MSLTKPCAWQDSPLNLSFIAMKPLYDLTFAEFAEAIRPSGGMNRWPVLGEAKEIVSYSVSMNGAQASVLEATAQNHEYRDVAIHALTDSLGLDSKSFRDNVKVAELLALRHTYLSTILDASFAHALSPHVQAEYALVSDGFKHPLVAQEIAAQRAFGALLKPALDDAERTVGEVRQERAAGGVSQGVIVSQNEGFTIQQVSDGVVVAHENRRLESLPAVGDNVTVAYYRGRGQVIERLQDLKISQPYVDQQSGDLAVNLFTDGGKVEQVIMFTNMVMLNEFAQENQLGRGFVLTAMEARQASPKVTPVLPQRKAIGAPYLDPESRGFAIDYEENSHRFTAIFNDAREMADQKLGLQLSDQDIARVNALSRAVREQSDNRVQQSWSAATHAAMDAEIKPVDREAGRYSGSTLAVTPVHIVQARGRGEVCIHDKRLLDKIPLVGESFTASYRGGRGEVEIRSQSKDRHLGR